VKEFGYREPLLDKTSKARPCHPALLATTIKYSQPAFAHLQPKALEMGEIPGDSMVVEVALNDAPQPLPDFRQRLMHTHPESVLHLFQFGEESLSDGLA